MALPHEVVRVTMSGDMMGGQEIWSTGFYLGFDASNASPIIEEGMSNIAAAWETFFKAPTSLISSNYKWKQLKCVRVGLDGRTIPDSAQYWNPPAVVSGGMGGTVNPPQIALVATLTSAVQRGLATKGRMFLPGINADLDATGHLSTTDVLGLATNLKTFFDAIHNDADTPGNLILASVGRGPLHTDGTIRFATGLKIGNVYDTQRRRRNALTEAYTVKALA